MRQRGVPQASASIVTMPNGSGHCTALARQTARVSVRSCPGRRPRRGTRLAAEQCGHGAHPVLRDEALALGPGAVGVGVAAGGVGEERPDDVGHLLQSAERADDRGFEVVGVGDAGAPDAVVRDVLQDPLVGVELRGVGGQHEQSQSPVGGGNELFDQLGRGGPSGSRPRRRSTPWRPRPWPARGSPGSPRRASAAQRRGRPARPATGAAAATSPGCAAADRR